jgi:phosphoglycolate phosphatase
VTIVRFGAILFDFDYTIADSSAGVIECVNACLRELRLPLASPESIRRTIGMSLPRTFVTLAGEQHAAKAEAFTAGFKRRADQVMAALTTVYPQVGPVVRELKRRAIRVGIVSTKFRYRIEQTLRREGMGDLFDMIVGGEDVSEPKPAPQGIEQAMTALRLTPSDILYVGDTTIDAETAARARVAFLAVLSGVTPRHEFSKHSTVGIVDDLGQLLEILT